MSSNETAVNHDSLYVTVANKIEHLIITDKMHTDSKLPSETYLAESFGVSRPVIREALKLLHERGLIQSRQGAASIITEPDTETLIKNMNRIVLMKKVSPMQVYEIRTVLETFSCSLASASFTQQDIEKLCDINSRLAKAMGDYELRAELDIEFHRAIAEISGNPLLVMMLDALSSLMKPLIVRNLTGLGSNDRGSEFHNLIISAIKTGNPEKASEAMREHLERSAEQCKGFSNDSFGNLIGNIKE